jgi:hypothetical protein
MDRQFPQASGSNLERERLTLPDDLEGEINLLLVAFQQWQQNQVDTWVPLARAIEQGDDRVRYYELPVLSRFNPLYRWFINEGMRAGIPDRLARERTITLYLDKPAFRQALDMPDEENIYVLAVDRTGRELWRQRGTHSPDKEAALVKLLGRGKAVGGGLDVRS